MLPSPSPVAENVLSTLGAVAWSIQLLPQILLNYRRHHTIGLQPSMMLLWSLAGIPLGVYNVASSFPTALIIQPQILTALSLLTLAQCMYYSYRWGFTQCVICLAVLALLLGGIEVTLIFALRIAAEREVQWPQTLMAVLSAVLLGAGVGAHYLDIWRTRSVRGISFLFVAIDAAGDLFSLLSLFWREEFDILGAVIYGVELALWTGVLACGLMFDLMPRILGSARSFQSDGHREGGLSRPNQGHPSVGAGNLELDASSAFRTASLDISEGAEVRRRVGAHADDSEMI